MMDNTEFARRIKDVALNYKTVYMLGCFGMPVTEEIIAYKSKQYPTWYTAARQAKFRALIGKGYFGFDCVNLDKGIIWGWDGDSNDEYGGAKYASNGVPDVSANGMIAICSNVSTDFSDIPVGAGLWLDGHFGTYIGDGLAVECTTKWQSKVQITAVGNIGPIAGYNTRTWTKWGKIPGVTYIEEVKASDPETPFESAVNKLHELGVINTPEHWLEHSHELNYVCDLIIKAANNVVSNGPRKATVEQGISSLVSVGVILSPEYWQENYNKLDYLGDLLKALGGCTYKGSQSANIYTVKAGDSLWSIAAKQLGNGVRWKEIKALNGLSRNTIYAGQALKLPK